MDAIITKMAGKRYRIELKPNSSEKANLPSGEAMGDLLFSIVSEKIGPDVTLLKASVHPDNPLLYYGDIQMPRNIEEF